MPLVKITKVIYKWECPLCHRLFETPPRTYLLTSTYKGKDIDEDICVHCYNEFLEKENTCESFDGYTEE